MFASNPFSTKFIAPGSIDYHCFHSTEIDGLVNRFLGKLPARASIVGPHGSGKSTLVATLLPSLGQSRAFHSVVHVQLSSDGTASRRLRATLRTIQRGDLLVVDGYEQTNRISRWMMEFYVARKQASTLVTLHESVKNFPVLWTTGVDKQVERFVIQTLLSSQDPSDIDELFASEAWAVSRRKHGENLRESLFDMYDWWQENKSRHRRLD